MSSVDAIINIQHVLLLLSLVQRETICAVYPGAWVLAQTGQVEDECPELCSCTFHFEDVPWVLVILRKGNGTSFHCLL